MHNINLWFKHDSRGLMLWCGCHTSFQAFEREPGAFAVVLVALPDFGDEACLGSELLHQCKQLHPVDFTIVNLQPLAVDAFGIGQMQVRRERKNRLEESTERAFEVGAGELGMGHIQADAHAGFLAEPLNEGGVNEEVVIALPTEVPGEGGHGLGNNLNFASGVDLLQAVDQALAQRLQLRPLEMVVL